MKEIWSEIEKEYEMGKRVFGKKIKFVKDKFKRKIIFRDVAQSFKLVNTGFPKPALILAGGVIEELLRLYLDDKGVKTDKNNFDSYIKKCEESKLLKSPIGHLNQAVRHFRNMVHLEKEETQETTINKAKAKTAVSAIFAIVNAFN
jgi:hypothetical protein